MAKARKASVDPVRSLRAQWIKVVRDMYGLTQQQLAERLGVHPTTVARWELRKTDLHLDLYALFAVGYVLGLEVPDVLRIPDNVSKLPAGGVRSLIGTVTRTRESILSASALAASQQAIAELAEPVQRPPKGGKGKRHGK